MATLVDTVVDSMAPQYPDLAEARSRLVSVASAEEATFLETLAKGTSLFAATAEKMTASGQRTITGTDAFTLHDTYGFPIDLTLEMAAEVGLDVDREGFAVLMAEQRDRAKADARARKAGLTSATVYRDIMESGGATMFTGYDEVTSGASIIGLVRDGVAVANAVPGDTVEVILDRSPFYAEAGGQLGDHGTIRTADGATLEVFDVQIPVPGLWIHRARVTEGEALTGHAATGTIDMERRRAISRAHTATHVIHKAFREFLGETATQMGSENAPGRLRFDFTATGALPPALLADVEARVNDVLLADLAVFAQQMTIDEARAMGAMALFGEKYGDRVRVVSIGDWAHELCGGTHAMRSGQLGVVSFLSEGSIGAGVRRLEALVGADAYRFLAREHTLVTKISELVKVPAEELPERIEVMLTRLKDAERNLARLKNAQMAARLDDIIGTGIDIGPYRMWTFVAPEQTDPGELRSLVLKARGMTRQDMPVAILGATSSGGKAALVAAANDEAQALGLTAHGLLAAALPAVSGRGGGKADVAQGGGTDPTGIDASLAAAAEYVRGLGK